MCSYDRGMVRSVVAALLLCAGAARADVVKLQGASGEHVAILPTSAKAALIRVTGSQTALDDLVLPYTIENDMMYLTQWRGRDFAFVQHAGDAWKLLVPGKLLKPIALTPSNEPVDGAALTEANAQQTRDGAIAKFAKFDRGVEEAEQEKQLRPAVAAFHKACKSKAELRVDWPTFNDATLRTVNVAALCENAVSAMTSLCGESHAAAQSIDKRVKGVACGHGEAVSIELLRDGILHLIVEEHGANLAGYVRDFINKTL
jgi:hypothetical protein